MQSKRVELRRKHSQITEVDVRQLQEVLVKYHTPPSIEDGQMCIRFVHRLSSKIPSHYSYDAYRKAAMELANEKLTEFFRPKVFMSLLIVDDPQGRCRIGDIIDYVTRCAWLDQYTLTLSLYDSKGNGTLCEQDLNAYIDSIIESVPTLSRMEDSFRPFYRCTCTRKFMFMLDVAHQDQVSDRVLGSKLKKAV